MNVGVKDIIIVSSFHIIYIYIYIYMLDVVETKLCTSKQHSLCDYSIKL